jgi:hypothetical protein
MFPSPFKLEFCLHITFWSIQGLCPAPECLGEHSQKHRRSFESFPDSFDRIGFELHIHTRSAQVLCSQCMTSLAKWGGERWVVVSASRVMLLNSDPATAQETPVLILAPGQSPGRFERFFVDHLDDSGKL